MERRGSRHGEARSCVCEARGGGRPEWGKVGGEVETAGAGSEWSGRSLGGGTNTLEVEVAALFLVSIL